MVDRVHNVGTKYMRKKTMGNKGEVSDGYHTFNELYEHRNLLFINLLNVYKNKSFKTRKHDDGSSYNGWFVGGMETESGQITYHLPDKFWDMLNVKELERMEGFDGHTSDDVLKRLEDLGRK